MITFLTANLTPCLIIPYNLILAVPYVASNLAPSKPNLACSLSARLVRSMNKMFSALLTPQHVRDIARIDQIISNIDTVTQLQDLTLKYKNAGKMATRTRYRTKKLRKKSIPSKSSFCSASLVLEFSVVLKCL